MTDSNPLQILISTKELIIIFQREKPQQEEGSEVIKKGKIRPLTFLKYIYHWVTDERTHISISLKYIFFYIFNPHSKKQKAKFHILTYLFVCMNLSPVVWANISVCLGIPLQGLYKMCALLNIAAVISTKLLSLQYPLFTSRNVQFKHSIVYCQKCTV